MAAEIDLWRAAHQVNKMHGKKAAWEAAVRHNSAREQGGKRRRPTVSNPSGFL
jgi:hypothetical protein